MMGGMERTSEEQKRGGVGGGDVDAGEPSPKVTQVGSRSVVQVREEQSTLKDDEGGQKR